MSFDPRPLSDAVRAHGAVIRIVVIRALGSTPREAGAAMLVWADGQEGTIGGGTLEWQAIAEARDVLQSGQDLRRRTLPLGPELGQCCGGSVTLVWERFHQDNLPQGFPFARPLGPATDMPDKVARRVAMGLTGPVPVELEGWLIEAGVHQGRPLWIWGAGHVGRAIAAVMAPLPDRNVTLIDVTEDKFPVEMPAGVTARITADPVSIAPQAPANADHLILTYSHPLDLALCHALLSQPCASIGLIGSATKWARFRGRLAALGHSTADISRIACPIGEPAFGKHPQAIAIGVAAALIGGATGINREERTG